MHTTSELRLVNSAQAGPPTLARPAEQREEAAERRGGEHGKRDGADGRVRRRPGVAGRRQHDADDGDRDADQLQQRGSLAGRERDDDRHDRAGGADRRDDAERPGRRRRVERGERQPVAHPGRDPEQQVVAVRRRPAGARQQQPRPDEADALPGQQHPAERVHAGQQRAEVVGQPVGGGGEQGEQDGRHGGQWSTLARVGPGVGRLGLEPSTRDLKDRCSAC